MNLVYASILPIYFLIHKIHYIDPQKTNGGSCVQKKPGKEQAWKEKLQRFERSGVNATKWCEQDQEKIHNLNDWKLRLKPSPTLSDFEEIPLVETSNDPIKIVCKTLSIELPIADQKAIVTTIERLLQCLCLGSAKIEILSKVVF